MIRGSLGLIVALGAATLTVGTSFGSSDDIDWSDYNTIDRPNR